MPVILTSKTMVFRQPSHLESFVPPPAEQVPQSKAWSGSLTLIHLNAARGHSYEDVYVTAAETDGDNRMDLWPSHLYVYFSQRRITLPDVATWVRRNSPPVCAFMPDRLSDPAANSANQARFTTFSRLLQDNEVVAYAPWNVPDRLLGAGIMMYPTPSSSSLLVGALFLSGNFPDFVTYSQQGPAARSHQQHSQPRHAPHTQTAGTHSTYGSPGPAHPSSSSSHRHHPYGVPADQMNAGPYSSSTS
ncbi:hypothetical protein EW146_g5771 [Bondarzewia mesenterica]|uniref:Uncharacterized protein n=1 Tax=Bondarzewia mesenterica TaxID=1095465 RepID=A0A4V3XEQ7_9AGAM|nr:hypothetical protein EW146_g5771 [Bondarzewia mesenterica]